MKITVIRTITPPAHQNAQEYMQNVFLSMSRKIQIAKVSVEYVPAGISPTSQEKITLECETIGVLENEALVQEVIRILKSHSDLKLQQIIIVKTILLDAIRIISNGIYGVSLNFAQSLAKNDNYRENLRSKNVAKVTMECKDVGNGNYLPTGRFVTELSSESKNEFNVTNPYHCFIAAMSEDAELRKVFCDEAKQDVPSEIQEMTFQITADRKIKVDYKLLEIYEVDVAKKQLKQVDTLGNQQDTLFTPSVVPPATVQTNTADMGTPTATMSISKSSNK